jgi:hypothetical protein
VGPRKGKHRKKERRAPGLVRVPLVQRCRLELESGLGKPGFLVNISILGAYVADDQQPPLGTRGRCLLQFPGSALETPLPCIVVWVNPLQQHPIHSLPPGYGVRFQGLDERTRTKIEDVIRDYVSRSGRKPEPGSDA